MAARQCMRDSATSPVLVTVVYMLIAVAAVFIYGVVMSLGGFSYEAFYRSGDFHIRGAQSGLLLTIFPMIWSLVVSVYSAGYYYYALKLSRGENSGFSDLFSGFRLFGKVLWLTILIGVFVTLWTCLFIIPGFVAAYRYQMAYYALFDNPNLTAREALNVSKRITYGHKGELFVLDLSFFGWLLLSGLTFGILTIWLTPYMQTTDAHAYNWLTGLQQGEGDSDIPSIPPYDSNQYYSPDLDGE